MGLGDWLYGAYKHLTGFDEEQRRRREASIGPRSRQILQDKGVSVDTPYSEALRKIAGNRPASQRENLEAEANRRAEEERQARLSIPKLTDFISGITNPTGFAINKGVEKATGVSVADITRELPSATPTAIKGIAGLAGPMLGGLAFTGQQVLTGNAVKRTDASLQTEKNINDLVENTIKAYREGKITRQRAEAVLDNASNQLVEVQAQRQGTIASGGVDPNTGKILLNPVEMGKQFVLDWKKLVTGDIKGFEEDVKAIRGEDTPAGEVLAGGLFLAFLTGTDVVGFGKGSLAKQVGKRGIKELIEAGSDDVVEQLLKKNKLYNEFDNSLKAVLKERLVKAGDKAAVEQALNAAEKASKAVKKVAKEGSEEVAESAIHLPGKGNVYAPITKSQLEHLSDEVANIPFTKGDQPHLTPITSLERGGAKRVSLSEIRKLSENASKALDNIPTDISGGLKNLPKEAKAQLDDVAKQLGLKNADELLANKPRAVSNVAEAAPRGAEDVPLLAAPEPVTLTPGQAKQRFKALERKGYEVEVKNTLPGRENPIPLPSDSTKLADTAVTTTKGGQLKPIARGGVPLPANVLELFEKGGKDKRLMFAYQRESPQRIIEDLFGVEQGKVLNDFLPNKVAINETNRVKWLNAERELVGSRLQELGVKLKNTEDRLAFDLINGSISEKQLGKYGKDVASRVKEAVELGRSRYREYLAAINQELGRFGYEPIKARKNYVTHLQALSITQEIFGGFANIGKSKLPTAIAAIEDIIKPGKKFFGFGKERKGGIKLERSLTQSLAIYQDAASKQIFHTDSVQRARLAQQGLEAAAKETAETNLNNFSRWMKDYAGSIAGSKASVDKSFENLTAQGILKAYSRLNRRVSSNLIGANVASAITNYIPITQLIGTTKKSSVAKGMFDAVLGSAGKVKPIDGIESGFLVRRFPERSFARGAKEKFLLDPANVLFEGIDRFTSETLVRSKYFEGRSQGLSKKAAMARADEFAAKAITDRTTGQLPTLFDSEALRGITMFNAEVNNQLSFFFKDVPRNAPSRVAAASQLSQVFLATYIYNNLFEKLTGRRPAFDPIGVVQDSVEDFSDPEIDKGKAIENVADRISDQLPFTSVITGGGRIPLSGVLPFSSQGVFPSPKEAGDTLADLTSDDPKRKQAAKNKLIKELSKPFFGLVTPTGGGQIRKTIEGLGAFNQGTSETASGKTRFNIEQNPQNFFRSLLGGAFATPDAQRYIRTGFKSPEERAKARGKVSGEKTIDTILGEDINYAKEFDERQNKIRQATNAEKQRLVDEGFTSWAEIQGIENKEKAIQAIAGKTDVAVPDGMSKEARNILNRLNRLSDKGKAKFETTQSEVTKAIANTWNTKIKESGRDLEFKNPNGNVAGVLARYEKWLLENPDIDEATRFSKEESFLTDAVKSEYADKIRKLDGMTKADLKRLADKGEISEAEWKEVLDLDERLVRAQLREKRKHGSGIGSSGSSSGSKGSGGSGGSKSTGGKLDLTEFTNQIKRFREVPQLKTPKVQVDMPGPPSRRRIKVSSLVLPNRAPTFNANRSTRR